MWAYFDESAEYGDTPLRDKGHKNLLNMSYGGCYAPLSDWQALELAWAKLCRDEGLLKDDRPWFHMVDFEAWAPPFDFKLPDGQRDSEKHKRVLNAILEIMLGHIRGFFGHFAVAMYDRKQPEITHRQLLDDCAAGAIQHAVEAASRHFRKRINLVFGAQKHLPRQVFDKYAAEYDWDQTNKWIKSLAAAEPIDVIPLQAADVWAYEVTRRGRANRPERYPFRRIADHCEKNGIICSLGWGPFRGEINV